MKLDFANQFEPILSPNNQQDEPQKVGPVKRGGKTKNRSQSNSIITGDSKVLRINEKQNSGMDPYAEKVVGNIRSRQSIISLPGAWNTEVENTPARRNDNSNFKSSNVSWNNI